MRGSVDYGDGFARPVEVCSGMIGGTKGGGANVRVEVKASAPNGGVAVFVPAVCKPSAGEGSIPSSVN